MKRLRQQLNVGTSYDRLDFKPFGFCCDIKKYGPKSLPLKHASAPPFPLSGPTGEGPDVKIRIQEEDDVLPSTKRGTQRRRSVLRLGMRSGIRVGQRGGLRGNQSRGVIGPMRFGHRRGKIVKPTGEQMKCKRCRGPLRYYLEEEIEVALDIIKKDKQQKYNAEMEKNIKIAKKRGTYIYVMYERMIGCSKTIKDIPSIRSLHE
ncbi:uncharacterized protein LOC108630434 isoform X2 [Ceratina calcarata]|uniref:Uncharacterized protein LOC108630434 isoform X2 n=1 Tax=Ceratina calcarata TaxID=156304 RepID=A0AAJ7WF41_9HYME|nr:uncharacterized protein LOC108630434 isoform X2 [Ceratina calcarata]